MKNTKIQKVCILQNNLPWVDYRKYDEETNTWSEWKKFKKTKAKYKNIEYRPSEIDPMPSREGNGGWPISTNPKFISTREDALLLFDFNLDNEEINSLIDKKIDISFIIKPGTRVTLKKDIYFVNHAEIWLESLQGATVTIKSFSLPIAFSSGNYPSFEIMENTRTRGFNINMIAKVGELAKAHEISYYKTVKIGAQPVYESTGNPNFHNAH